VIGIVDGTVCPVEVSPEVRDAFVLGSATVVKYIVVVRIYDGKIIFVSDSLPGRRHEWLNQQNTDESMVTNSVLCSLCSVSVGMC